ncbi:MAG: tetratricopeptide repeat protein [Nitrospirae bacterium]|nr:tetratricopeptide repeat protein [Nitrospirota bacterium]
MPRAIKKKVKHKDVAVETEVQDRISDIKELMRRKQRAVVMYGSAAALGIALVSGGVFYKYASDDKARQIEYEAYKVYHNEFQKSPLSKQEQFKKAADLFNQAYSKSKSPRLLLYIAGSYAEVENYPEAIKTLELFIKDHSSEKNLLPLAYRQLASVRLRAGNRADALKAFDSLYALQGDMFKDLALMESARILEADGKKDEAAGKYKEITEKFKDSPFYNEAKSKVDEKKAG